MNMASLFEKLRKHKIKLKRLKKEKYKNIEKKRKNLSLKTTMYKRDLEEN